MPGMAAVLLLAAFCAAITPHDAQSWEVRIRMGTIESPLCMPLRLNNFHHVLQPVTMSWGSGQFGQLGVGSLSDSLVPLTFVWSPPIFAPLQVCAHYNHVLAVAPNGTVFAWGKNANSQLGDGTSVDAQFPVMVQWNGDPYPFPATIMRCAVGGAHSCVVSGNLAVYCWGANNYGQLGDNSVTPHPYPMLTATIPSPVFDVQCGFGSTVALGTDGNVYTWGFGYNLAPTVIAWTGVASFPSGGVVSVASGDNHILMRSGTGLYSVGDNGYGQLGYGHANPPPPAPYAPEAVIWTTPAFPSGVARMAAGACVSLVIGADQVVYAWGCNVDGTVGDTTSTDRYNPVTVVFNAPFPTTGFTDVAAGLYHCLALHGTGSVFAWGVGAMGQLGNGLTATAFQPVATSLSGVGLRVAAGAFASYAVVIVPPSVSPTASDTPSATGSPSASPSISLSASVSPSPASASLSSSISSSPQAPSTSGSPSTTFATQLPLVSVVAQSALQFTPEFIAVLAVACGMGCLSLVLLVVVIALCVRKKPPKPRGFRELSDDYGYSEELSPCSVESQPPSDARIDGEEADQETVDASVDQVEPEALVTPVAAAPVREAPDDIAVINKSSALRPANSDSRF